MGADEQRSALRELLVRVAAAMRDVKKIRIDSVSSKTAASSTEETRTTTIHVGEDVFRSTTDESEWPQRLSYAGVSYVRDRDTSPWMREPVDHRMGMELRQLEVEGPPEDPELLGGTFCPDLQLFLDGTWLPARSAGASQLRGTTREREESLPPIADDMIRQIEQGRVTMEESNKQETLANLARIPTRIKMRHTIWIGPDGRIQEREDEVLSFRDDEPLETAVKTSTYSNYGTAELPGPLPGA